MNILELKNVSFKTTEKTILEDISMTIKKGDWLTLVGPSGSGKSTVLKLLSALQSPTSGEILFEGKNLDSLNLVEYRKEVSYFFQQAVLFGDTVRDNLSFPFEIRNIEFDENKAIEALKKVNLTEEFLNKKVIELSGGEKQRVAVIRNLMFEPKVLLLDEISAGLDTDTKMLVHNLIKDYHKSGKTIIEITHDKEEIEMSKNIFKIVGGKVGNE